MISENEIYNALHKKSMQKLLDSEMKATVEVLKKRNLPLRILMIDSIEPKLIGSLMMFFFMETIFGCLLLNTNPFDQPAVEDGKKLIKEFLQKNE
jgi:glucose-6-phosphate isomerase